MNNDNLHKALEADRRSYALKFPHIYGKGYNPDEPRVPPGTPDGGQWTTGGATVSIHSGKTITIHHADGSTETRTGGSLSWRNNNPGNLITGAFANQHGAIGNNSGFAVFPDAATGEAASKALLQTSTYSPLTIDDAIARRSPYNENDTAQVQRNVRSIGKFSGREIVGDLDQNGLSRLVDAIKKVEGWWPGAVATAPKP